MSNRSQIVGEPLDCRDMGGHRRTDHYFLRTSLASAENHTAMVRRVAVNKLAIGGEGRVIPVVAMHTANLIAALIGAFLFAARFVVAGIWPLLITHMPA